MIQMHHALARDLAARFAQMPQVEAVAIGGSVAAGTADLTSDIDLYVIPTSTIPAAERLAVAQEYTADAKLNDFWGPGVEWTDPASGIHVDVMFFGTQWWQDQIDHVLVHHTPGVGYSTCIWHTIRQMQPLYDPNSWLDGLQDQAARPYPEALAANIIANNLPLMRQNESAYYYQIKKAVKRGDLISVNHRVAEFLASYFDIIFAVNHMPHPGEKRLLERAEALCARLPDAMSANVTALITSIGNPDIDTMAVVDALIDGIEDLVGSA